MLAPYPVRLRSNSSPSRHRPSISGSSTQPTSPSTSESSTQPTPPRLSSDERPLPPASDKASDPVISSIKPKKSHASPARKMFSLKRPSSSGSALQPSYERDTHSSAVHPAATPPPRPPRNPARDSGGPRPSSSAGNAERRKSRVLSRPSTASEKDTVPGDFKLSIFPLPQSSSVLQRRKSRGSKARAPVITAETPAGLQFSTVDRTILEELKQKMQAREAQFKVWNGKKHHPHSVADVPYPRSYEREVIDLDTWETRCCQDICGSVTWHVFDQPPIRVLDIGCGSGSWIMECARVWKDSHFVGLDIVPLHPDLQQLGSYQLASRITWIQANFLERLPFQDDEFDYIHVKRIARGVPEDKWDSLFEEISRVLKPGGAYEHVEEDLYFPGRPRGSQPVARNLLPDPPSPRTVLAGFIRSQSPVPLPANYTHLLSDPFVDSKGDLVPTSRPPHKKRSYSHPMPLQANPHTPPVEDGEEEEAHVNISTGSLLRSVPKAPIDPRDHSTLEFIYNEMHAARFINLEPLSLLANSMSLIFKDVRTHPPVIMTFPPLATVKRYPQQSTEHVPHAGDTGLTVDIEISKMKLGLDWAKVEDRSDRCNPELATQSFRHFGADSVSLTQMLNKSQPYIIIDDSRLVGFSPSSRPSLPRATVPYPSPPPTNSSTQTLSTLNDDLSVQPVPPPALTPTHRPKQNHLPNSMLNFDIRALNGHLTLRMQEVLGCAEPMWDFVLKYQDVHLRQEMAQQMAQPSGEPKTRPKRSAPGLMHQTLMNMTRNDFDDLLTRFELDMQDCIGLRTALADRLDWGPVPTARSQRRKAFDQLCVQWAAYHEQSKRRPRHDHDHADASEGSVSGHGTAPSRRTDASFGGRRDTVDHDLDHGPPNPYPPHTPTDRLNRTFRVFVAWKA